MLFNISGCLTLFLRRGRNMCFSLGLTKANLFVGFTLSLEYYSLTSEDHRLKDSIKKAGPFSTQPPLPW
jgi:hypothetical protein